MNASAAAVKVEGLGKRFGDLAAVRGVSFDVGAGEIFGFLGPNGAGKTTTINMLCTLLRPSAGSARVAGFDVVAERAAVRRSIGLVFQETTLDDYLTAEQNLRFHGYAYGMPRPLRETRMREVLELVELTDRRRDRINTFSGGMKRRLEIARGLMHHPRVLFLDEPTLGLDPQTRRRIWDHLGQMRRQESLTIFVTTHYMDEAEYCDRIGIIDHGEIVALDTPARLKTRVGGDVITLTVGDNAAAVRELHERWGYAAEIRDEAVSLRVPDGERVLPDLVRGLSQPIVSVGLRRPTLDDVFLSVTGRAIRQEEVDPMSAMMRARMRWRRR